MTSDSVENELHLLFPTPIITTPEMLIHHKERRRTRGECYSSDGRKDDEGNEDDGGRRWRRQGRRRKNIEKYFVDDWKSFNPPYFSPLPNPPSCISPGGEDGEQDTFPSIKSNKTKASSCNNSSRESYPLPKPVLPESTQHLPPSSIAGEGRRRAWAHYQLRCCSLFRNNVLQALISLLSLLPLTSISQAIKNLSSLLPTFLARANQKSPQSVRCQINSVRSDFIYIVMALLCFMPPVVTPVITSNSILPVDAPEDVMPVEGVLGKRFEMPCELRTSRRDDAVYMVLWFRGNESVPIYSLDARGKPFSAAKRWSADLPFGKRGHFQTSSEVAKLVVEDSKVSDQGIYRCRVDYRNSPSRETRLNLTITVPPQEPIIVETLAQHHVSELGPYPEGHQLHLKCIVRGGSPSPEVSWYLNDFPLPSSVVTRNDREVIHEVKVPTLTRNHHRALLSCKARNSKLIPSISKTVIIELNLRPLTVAIQRRHNELSTDTQYEIMCESWGANPPANISWFLDDVKLNATTEEIRTSNSTVSRLTFNPTPSVDGLSLLCRSENGLIPGAFVEDSWKLKVVYAPILTLRLGTSLNPNSIKEGDDVYFECIIKSSPTYDKLSWFHNNVVLSHRTPGIILSNQSLVLQKVSRPSAGNYSCRASNEQGSGESNQVRLGIMYAPACRTDMFGSEAVIIAASRSEDVNITCHMDALPDNLKFSWTHTNTVGDSTDLLPEVYSAKGSKSLLRYHLRAEEDFGTILCWASNSIGHAERPCVYQIVPAETPSPVENCSIINRTSTSVEITCEAGFDGGLPQSFYLEAYQYTPSSRRGLKYNVSSSSPSFSLSGLDADGTFHFKIFSVNRKGRSVAAVMDGIALTYPPMQSAKVRDLKTTTIAIIIGAVSAVVLSSVSLIAFVIHRRKHPITEEADLDKSYSREFRSSRRSSTNDELYHNGSKKNHEAPNMLEIPFKKSATDFDEDGDPDLIPNTKNGRTMGDGGKMYSRLSNGEINQRGYTNTGGAFEKIPLRTLPPSDVPLSPDHSNLSNYATFRGKPNGFQVKPVPVPPRREGHQLATSIAASGNLQGKPSSIVVNIDSRLIGQQLASNQLPESCV